MALTLDANSPNLFRFVLLSIDAIPRSFPVTADTVEKSTPPATHDSIRRDTGGCSGLEPAEHASTQQGITMYRQRVIGVLRHNPTATQTVEEPLTMGGYRVVPFDSPQQIIEAIKDGGMDGLMVHLRTEEGTGVEFVRQLRAQRLFLPVFLILNPEDLCDPSEARAAGIFEVLRIPVDPLAFVRLAGCWFGAPHTIDQDAARVAQRPVWMREES